MIDPLKRLRRHLPAWVAEVGKVTLGAGVGAWLAWAGAVASSISPHHLHYWATPSMLATVAMILGAILWIIAVHDDPRIAMLQTENDRLHGHLSDAHQAFARVSGGITKSAGPPAGPSNVVFPIAASGSAVAQISSLAPGEVRFVPPTTTEDTDSGDGAADVTP
jgi:hypothetical protein